MVSNIKSLVFSVFVVFLISFNATADLTSLQASIDRNPVMEREPFVLKIEANDSINTNDLDLSPLQNGPFTVGRTATGSQTQIINGSMTRTTTWSVVLVAKQAGEFTIPSFQLNGVKSQPIKVTVVKPSNTGLQRNESIFIDNTLSPQKVYVQQSIKLTTKLYVSPQVELQSGRLSEPTLQGAIIKQHGKDKDSTEIVNGIRYRVIERVYTITPQASGQFTIESPEFNGDVTSRNSRRSSFSSFIQSKPVSAYGENFAIDVLPIPADYVGAWLPSDLVQLNEEWTPTQNTVEVGEPITRTYTLTALNVSEEQLPEIKSEYPSEFSVYPDKSETHSVIRDNALVSQRVSSEAIVANRPGTYTLPAVKLSWFNTKIRRIETATLPERVIKVTPSANAAIPVPPPVGVEAESDESSSVATPQDQTECNCDAVGISTSVNNYWLWLGLTVVGWLGAICFAILYLFEKRKHHQSRFSTGVNYSQGSTQNFDLASLKRACLAHQPEQAYQLLKAWAAIHKPECRHMRDFENSVHEDLKQQIRLLAKARFGHQQNDTGLSQPVWRGEALWQAIEAENKGANEQTAAHSNLPPLNPS
ncbi:protein BatD [Psychrosphaera ytuae]|uniref:Protein BatD n=1 Tax=Psychrosphaera ytuae TaxID=2820710 RepID=A0A975DAS1_9GAMM|nr:BatD family protein [Psychrosphaera ytuae]QTH63696.1 protein BatD [Psychrosphaera ytuae]